MRLRYKEPTGDNAKGESRVEGPNQGLWSSKDNITRDHVPQRKPLMTWDSAKNIQRKSCNTGVLELLDFSWSWSQLLLDADFSLPFQTYEKWIILLTFALFFSPAAHFKGFGLMG